MSLLSDSVRLAKEDGNWKTVLDEMKTDKKYSLINGLVSAFLIVAGLAVAFPVIQFVNHKWDDMVILWMFYGLALVGLLPLAVVNVWTGITTHLSSAEFRTLCWFRDAENGKKD